MATPDSPTIEVAVKADAVLGEGPSWDATAGVLLWVDILGNRIHRSDLSAGTTETRQFDDPVGAIVPTDDGRLLLTTPRGLSVLDDMDTHEVSLVSIEADNPQTRMNDGKCDPLGCLWTGTMASDATLGAGRLYRVGTDLRTEVVLSEVTVSNGLAFLPDLSCAYYIDTPLGRIDRLALDESGLVRERSVLIDVQDAPGVPDGMTIDDDGCVWAAFCGGGQVRRITPDGRLDRVISLPVNLVTSVEFGGPDGAVLFVTTGRYGLDEQQLAAEPLAGSVLAIDAGVTGRSGPAFRLRGAT
jgi:sugar lactone lactonase YvrE